MSKDLKIIDQQIEEVKKSREYLPFVKEGLVSTLNELKKFIITHPTMSLSTAIEQYLTQGITDKQSASDTIAGLLLDLQEKLNKAQREEAGGASEARRPSGPGRR